MCLLQDGNKAPGSPTSLRVPSNGGCEDIDMEMEEEDDIRARGELCLTDYHISVTKSWLIDLINEYYHFQK